MSDTDNHPIEDVTQDQPTVEDGDTFPRHYVEELRTESKGYRERATAAEENAEKLATRLHYELVKGTGKLADPTDLTFDAAHLENDETLNSAIDALLEDKPHLKARKFAPVDQGVKGKESEPFSLIGALQGKL